MKSIGKSTFFLVSFSLALLLVLWFIFEFPFHLDSWEVEIEGVGTLSSARATDLNSDGVLDIIIGAGSKEYEHSEYGVIAFDGRSGQIIWNVPCRNQIIGSAIFLDITKDGIDDVFIGGRSAQLLSIDGSSGEVLWEYYPSSDSMNMEDDTTLLNFFNPQLIGDLDDDSFPDLLIPFGGYVKALPNEDNRPSGYLMIISAKTGKILAKASMPDSKETYLSPVVHDFDGDGELSVIFGSGGETIDGSLYYVDLSAVINEDLSTAIELAKGNGKGFIAPPVLVDITNDDILDIVINSFNGTRIAINGSDLKVIWSHSMNNVETYSCVAPIDQNGDDVLDFFSSYGVGTWPEISESIQIVMDGNTGAELQRYHIGTFQYSSPLIQDFTQDDHPDIVFSANISSEAAFKSDSLHEPSELYRYDTEIIVFDLQKATTFRIDEKMQGTNLGGTPLLLDLDADGRLDMITVRNTDPFDFFEFNNFSIKRSEFKVPISTSGWGAYMGTHHDAIFHQ